MHCPASLRGVLRLPPPATAASQSRCRPSRSPPSSRSTTNSTTTSWYPLRPELDLRQPVPPARHVAFDIAGQTGVADLRPHGVDHARCGSADLALQRRATIALAAHPGLPLVDILCWNEIERRIVLDGEARPVRR